MTPDGRWRFPADLSADAIAAARAVAPLGRAVAAPRNNCGSTSMLPADVLPARHDHLPRAARHARHPVRRQPTRRHGLGAQGEGQGGVAAAGVAVPAGEVLRAGEQPTPPPPVVVKPADADNSLGVALVRREGEYGPPSRGVRPLRRPRWSRTTSNWGREVRCGVLARGSRYSCLAYRSRSTTSIPSRDPFAATRTRSSRTGGGDLRTRREGHRAGVDRRYRPTPSR